MEHLADIDAPGDEFGPRDSTSSTTRPWAVERPGRGRGHAGADDNRARGTRWRVVARSGSHRHRRRTRHRAATTAAPASGSTRWRRLIPSTARSIPRSRPPPWTGSPPTTRCSSPMSERPPCGRRGTCARTDGADSWARSTPRVDPANALPDAIGVQASHPGRQVVTLSGDGGLSMLMGELLTLRQQQLPVKVVVLNNGALAFVELEMKADRDRDLRHGPRQPQLRRGRARRRTVRRPDRPPRRAERGPPRGLRARWSSGDRGRDPPSGALDPAQDHRPAGQRGPPIPSSRPRKARRR